MQLLKSNYKNYDMLDKETTFNMNTASLHKINRESQKKGKLLQYISFINCITFVNIEFKTTYSKSIFLEIHRNINMHTCTSINLIINFCKQIMSIYAQEAILITSPSNNTEAC